MTVGRTAHWIAHGRAAETLRADRLFADPFAVAVVTTTDPALIDRLRGRPTARFDVLAVRTRFFDDYLIDAVAGGRRAQVVLLAAGFDSRAFRLEWPAGTHLYEVDLPEMIDEKAALLAGGPALPVHCERHTVPVDLTGDWCGPLRDTGFDPDLPTVWLAEGLLYYLTGAQVDALLDTVTSLSAPGSTLGLEHVNTDLYRAPWMRSWLADMREQGHPWQSGVADPEQWLTGHGWHATVREPSDLPIAGGRLVPRTPPRQVPGAARTWLVTAHRTPSATASHDRHPLPSVAKEMA